MVMFAVTSVHLSIGIDSAVEGLGTCGKFWSLFSGHESDK